MFVEAKDDGGGGDNWTTGAISHAKLQSNHHHQQTNIQLIDLKFFNRHQAYLKPIYHSGISALKLYGTIQSIFLAMLLPGSAHAFIVR